MTSRPQDHFDDLPILGELRETLERRFAGSAARAAGRWRRNAPVALAAAVAVAVAALALTLGGKGQAPATHGPGGSLPGSEQQALRFIRTAARNARRTGACRAPVQNIPAVIHGSPSQALLSELSVLRRPATAADRLPSVVQGIADVRGVYVNYTRRARVLDGIAYYILPARSVGQLVLHLSARCDAAMALAFHNELRRIPKQLRAQTTSLWDRLVVAQQRQAPGDGDGICLLFAAGQSGGGECGATATQLQRTGMITAFGLLSGVVPDGVASVSVSYPDGTGRARTVTANVVGNVFITPFRNGHPPLSPSITWRSAQGRVIKVVAAAEARTESSGFCASAAGSNLC